MSSRVATLMRDQREYVQELAVAALEVQKERLAEYDKQAKLGLAQIYDPARKPKADANRPR